MTAKHFLNAVSCVLLAGVLVAANSAAAADLIKLRVARLAFPSMSSLLLDVLKARDIDKKHGFDVETISQNAVAVYYASIANGDADLLAGGPHVFQKMILQGVPIKVIGTWAPLKVLSVITAEPDIKSLADLKGKSIAAAVGSSEYQITSIYGRKLGLTFGKDVTVVDASPPLAMAQLAAKRVDAAMLWEPTTTLALHDNPAYRVIMSGNAAWHKIAGEPGWDLVLAAGSDFVEHNAALVPRAIGIFRDTQKYIHDHVDDADGIVSKSVKLPRGIFKDGVQSGRLVFDVVPATGKQRQEIWDMFKVAVDTGYLPKMPSEDAIYKP